MIHKMFSMLIVGFFFFTWANSALANLQVFPTRLVLSNQSKAAHLSIRHLGDKPERYRVSTVFYRMRKDGTMEVIKDPKPEEMSATALLRYSPREVILQPRLEQVVRVMYYSSTKVEDGEYRAHIHFEPIGLEGTSAEEQDSGQMRMQLQAKIAVAVPVIYRQGKVDGTVSLSNLRIIQLPDKSRAFSVVMSKQGKRFVYGDFKAIFTPSGGKSQDVGFVAGISSYIDERTAQYPLTIPEGLKLEHGVLALELREPTADGGQLLSKTELNIP